MSKKRSRRHYTNEQKIEILRRHLVGKVPVSELCNELELQPSVFYLEAKLAKKDGVIAELASEYTQLKKELGEP